MAHPSCSINNGNSIAPEFQLPACMLERLRQLGVTDHEKVECCSRIWQSSGEESVWIYIKSEQEAAAKFAQWSPRLREYADECRTDSPLPSRNVFSEVEQLQYTLLVRKMQSTKLLPGIPRDRVTIVTSSPMGLAAATAVFGNPAGNVVYLTDPELDTFFRNVCHYNFASSTEEPWWFFHRWWTITTGDGVLKQHSFMPLPELPPGAEYWDIIEGGSGSSLSGGMHHEMWAWDGKRVMPVEDYEGLTSF